MYGIELGHGDRTHFPRHPMAMAAHAVTAANALQGQFTLGIGLSHEPMMAQLGIAFDRPIRHLREYLNVLMLYSETARWTFVATFQF